MIWLLLLLSAEPAVPNPNLHRFERSQIQMGTNVGIVVYARDESLADRACSAAFRRFEELNAIFSDYDSTSELSRLSAAAPTDKPVAISAELAFVLGAAQRLSEQTDGAFDVTVGPLTKLWRRARRQKLLPEAERIEECRQAVGYRHLIVDEAGRTARLLRPQMRLDAGGIAMGYAADEAIRVLKSFGITRALINGSGDFALGDPPPGERGWKIEIAGLNPGDAPPDQPRKAVWLSNCGITTSGDAFQFLVANGKRYSHILDPRTGYGLTWRSSVTVIAPTGMAADSLATALSVMPARKGLDWVRDRPGTAVLIVVEEEGVVKSYQSRDFWK